MPVGPAGGAGLQQGLFPLLLCRARADAWSRDRLSPCAPLASMDSLASQSRSSSISTGSLCSFPEPWPGAMAELAAPTRSRSPSPKAVKGPVREPGPAPRQEPPVEVPAVTEQEQAPKDCKDKVPTSSSSPVTALVSEELILELIRAFRDTTAKSEQRCELLRALLTQPRWTADDSRGTSRGTPPEETSHPPASMEVQDQPELLEARVWPQCAGEELPRADVDTNDSVDGDMDKVMEEDRSSPMDLGTRTVREVKRICSMVLGKSSPTRLGRSMVELDRSSPKGLHVAGSMGPGRRSSMGLRRRSHREPERVSPLEWRGSSSMRPGRSSSTGLDRSTPTARDRSPPAEPSPWRQWVPTGRAHGQASPRLCPVAQCLREGCTRLWRSLKAWWRRHFEPHYTRIRKPSWWQSWYSSSSDSSD